MYSYKFGDTMVGKARLEDVDASYKDLAEVCSNIRRSKIQDALGLLEKAAAGEAPIRYRKYISKLAHRKELCGKPGRYPKKSAKIVLGVLKSAIASAKAKGMSEDLIVVHAAANKKDVFPRLSPKGGKRSRSYYETARVEIVVRETNPSKKAPEKKGAQKRPEAQKAPEAQKPEAKPVQKPADKKPEPAQDHEHPHVHEAKVEAKAKKKQAAPKGEF